MEKAAKTFLQKVIRVNGNEFVFFAIFNVVFKIFGNSHFLQETFLLLIFHRIQNARFASGSKFLKASLETCFSIQFATITCFGFFPFSNKFAVVVLYYYLQSTQVSTKLQQHQQFQFSGLYCLKKFFFFLQKQTEHQQLVNCIEKVIEQLTTLFTCLCTGDPYYVLYTVLLISLKS